MAYRYEGMRLADFTRCVRELQQELQGGVGPYHKREVRRAAPFLSF